MTVLTAVGLTFYKVNHAFGSMYQPDHGLQSTDSGEGSNLHPKGNEEATQRDEKKVPEPVSHSVLLLGVDSRSGVHTLNTDVMMVAVLNPETKNVTLLSIPRDTRMKVSGYPGYHKVNAVYALGEKERQRAEENDQPVTENGIRLLKKTLSEYLGIPIQHYVKVDFRAFTSVIDSLNGIQVNVDRTLIYDDPTDNTHIYLEKGLQTLSGKEALDYVRHRLDNRGPDYYSSDFDRNRRQQQVIKALADKAKSFQGLTRFYDMLDAAGQYVRTDIDMKTMVNFATTFGNIGSEGVKTLENNAYWESSIGFTLIPEKTLDDIRDTLHREMYGEAETEFEN